MKKDSLGFQMIYCCMGGMNVTLVTGLLMFAVVKGIIDAFPHLNPYIYFAAILSVSFYMAWILGWYSSGFNKLNHFLRGLLSTVFLNLGVVWLFKSWYDLKRIPPALVIIIVLNILLAVYGSQRLEKYANVSLDKMDVKSQAWAVIAFMPFLFIGIFWIVVFGLLSCLKI